MSDSLQKLKLYFKSVPDYWELPQDVNSDRTLGFYPLSFKKRLEQGHYLDFDEMGIPMFRSGTGQLVYFCTGMCSFAFAHWEKYLLGEGEEHKEKILLVADKLEELAVNHPSGISMIYDYDDTAGNNPVACAMNHGEAISVLLRADDILGMTRYRELALRLAKAFEFPYGMEGVSGTLPENGSIWYLEGGKTILNGHIYSLFGLKELGGVTEEKWVNELYVKGYKSVVKSISWFDCGKWSWYWREKPLYIASAMYHNLHMCQLAILANWENDEKLYEWHNRFSSYYSNPFYRILAGWKLVYHKMRKRF